MGKICRFKKRRSDSAKDPVPTELMPIGDISDVQRKMLEFCTVPRSMTELQDNLGFSNRSYFKAKTLDPLIDARLVKMTNPDKPRASNQKYVVSDNGFRLLEVWAESGE